jgi:hypothetical protein
MYVFAATTPYPCTQKYAFGSTPHPPPKAYVLYGWPHKVNPSSRLIWNLFVEVSPELHVKNIQTVSTTKTRYALALMQCWFKFYSSDGPKFGQFIYRWNYLVALVESRGLGPIWEHVLCQSAFYSLFCKTTKIWDMALTFLESIYKVNTHNSTLARCNIQKRAIWVFFIIALTIVPLN